MSIIKEPCSNAATSEQGMKIKAGGQASIISDADCITQFVMRKGFIGKMLNVGEMAAIKGEKLKALAGMKTIRELRSAVEQERLRGEIILTSNQGYFLPETDSQGVLTDAGYIATKRFYRMMRAKAIGTFRSAKSARLKICEYEEKHGARTD